MLPNVQTEVDIADQQLIQLRDDVDDLLMQLSVAELRWSRWLVGVADVHRASARNMVHYWALRQNDLRDLQARLAQYGLSSLGRSEPHVEVTLVSVRSAISAMLDEGVHDLTIADAGTDQGADLLRSQTRELLGPCPTDRVTRIMVTLPSAAATDATLVRELVERGMNIARINCAHDDAGAWRAMARHVRQANEVTGRKCLVAMDLAGPKLRTGPLQPGPRSVKIRPRRNAVGQVTAPTEALDARAIIYGKDSLSTGIALNCL